MYGSDNKNVFLTGMFNLMCKALIINYTLYTQK
jgi:hypothetical protein